MYGYDALLGGLSLDGSGGSAVAVAAVAVLVVAVALYVALAPHGEDGGARGVRAFVAFDRLVLGPILRFCYLLAAVGGVAALVLALVRAASLSSGYGASLALGSVLAFVLWEVGARVVFELLMLSVRSLEHLASIDDRVQRLVDQGERPRPAPTAPAPRGAVSARPAAGRRPAADAPVARTQAMPAVSARPTEVVRPQAGETRPLDVDAAAEGSWSCACGARRNEGAFCGNCGRSRAEGSVREEGIGGA